MTIAAGKQVVALSKTNATTGQVTTVYIEAAKVDEILANKFMKSDRPLVGEENQDTKNTGTMIKDLKKFSHVFNIQGYLSASETSGNAGLQWSGGDGTMRTTKDVKNALIKDIIYPSGDIELHYRDYKDTDYGEYYGNKLPDAATDHVKVNIDKLQLTDASLRTDVDSTAVNRYAIQINLTRGKIK